MGHRQIHFSRSGRVFGSSHEKLGHSQAHVVGLTSVLGAGQDVSDGHWHLQAPSLVLSSVWLGYGMSPQEGPATLRSFPLVQRPPSPPTEKVAWRVLTSPVKTNLKVAQEPGPSVELVRRTPQVPKASEVLFSVSLGKSPVELARTILLRHSWGNSMCKKVASTSEEPRAPSAMQTLYSKTVLPLRLVLAETSSTAHLLGFRLGSKVEQRPSVKGKSPSVQESVSLA